MINTGNNFTMPSYVQKGDRIVYMLKYCVKLNYVKEILIIFMSIFKIKP